MRKLLYMLIVILPLGAGLLAQGQAARPGPDVYSQMRWRYIGPEGNRVSAVAGVVGDTLTYYAGSASGGIAKTIDGGVHWENIFDKQEAQSIGALAVAPSDPNLVWAGTGEAWIRSHISIGDGIYKSTDGGVTWTKLTGHGLPTKPVGKVMPAIAHSNPRRVYAAIETGDGVPWKDQETEPGQVWRSDDGGENWTMATSDRNAMGRTAYYGRMAASTDNEDETYYLNASYSKSIDGALTIVAQNGAQAPGGDHHDMWIDPSNGNRMIVAHDQGVSISQTRGRSWLKQRLQNAQLYHVTVDNQIPYYVYTNKQDGPSYRGPSNSRLDEGGGRGGGGGRAGIPRGMWHSVGGGESGFATPDPVDPNIIWSTASGSGSVGGIVVRYDQSRRQLRDVEVWPDNENGPPADLKYRFVWDAPFHISPHDHNKIYVGSQYLHQSIDGGQSWQEISPDLTLNDKSRQQSSGGLTPDNIGVEYGDVIHAIAESPKQAGVIWVGTNDGLVQVTRDGGKSWTNVTKNMPNLPPS